MVYLQGNNMPLVHASRLFCITLAVLGCLYLYYDDYSFGRLIVVEPIRARQQRPDILGHSYKYIGVGREGLYWTSFYR